MDVTGSTQAIAERMSARLRVKGADLAEVAARAGRRIPRRLRDDVETLIRAEAMSRHPKLARQVDPRRLSRATRNIDRFLAGRNPAAERWAELQDNVAKVAFVVFVAALAVFFWLVSNGYFEVAQSPG